MRPTAKVVPFVRRGVTALVVGKALEWTARNALPKVLSLAVRSARPLPAKPAHGEILEPDQPRVFGITRVWQEVRWYVPPTEKSSPWWSPFRR